MSLLIQVLIYVLALLSVAAGVPKVMQMPQELELLGALGMNALIVSVVGIVQAAGGLLLTMARFRIVGALLAGVSFFTSSVALLLGGDVQFGLISVAPIIVLGVVVWAERVRAGLNTT